MITIWWECNGNLTICLYSDFCTVGSPIFMACSIDIECYRVYIATYRNNFASSFFSFMVKVSFKREGQVKKLLR